MVNDLDIVYSNKKVTPFGGMSLLKRFIEKLGVRGFINGLKLPRPGSNRGYNPAHIVESFWLGIWTGASRYIHCDWLRYDEVLQKIFGYQSKPSQSTYSRFFGKFSWKTNTEVFPSLMRWFIERVNVGKLTVDFDSSVITRYGDQEGSAKGYNPNKRGRNSHHPLMAFVSQTNMVANAWLRPGNTGDSSNAQAFLKETFNEVLPKGQVGLIRSDSGFYSDEILSFLEDRKLKYAVAAKFYGNLKMSVSGLKDWVEVAPGICVAEMKFAHPTHKSGRKRRYIVVRKEIDKHPDANGKWLFPDLPAFRYSCFVTNLDFPVNEIYRVYNGRADCENRIKELKMAFGLENFCLESFWGTEASYRFIMAAYNIIALFRHFALNDNNRATLSTLRSYCFALGAWTSSNAGKTILKISLPVKKRPWMNAIFSNINGLSPPFSFSNA